jgi:hypothetical protein
MRAKSVTVYGEVDKPPAGRLDFIFFCSDDPYGGWYRVHLLPEHVVKYRHLLVINYPLRLVVDIDREKGEMYLHMAELDRRTRPAE